MSDTLSGNVWFGVALPQLRASFDEMLQRALVAERTGFDSIWIMDHLVPEHPLGYDGKLNSFEGWTFATALAAGTSRIRVAHTVLCDGFRHPALLARMIATLDVISGGRFELGIGWGSHVTADELRRYGYGTPSNRDRADRIRETLDIVRLMLACQPFDYDGRHFQLRDALARPTRSRRAFRSMSVGRAVSSRCRSCGTTPTGGAAHPTSPRTRSRSCGCWRSPPAPPRCDPSPSCHEAARTPRSWNARESGLAGRAAHRASTASSSARRRRWPNGSRRRSERESRASCCPSTTPRRRRRSSTS